MKKALVTILVVIFATAVFGQVKTVVKPENLRPCIKEWVKVNFKDFSIEKAYKIETKYADGVFIIYSVCVGKGKEKQYFTLFSCQKFRKISKDEFEGKVTPAKPGTSTKPVNQPDKGQTDQGWG
jgi:hypothetical protein